MLLLYIAKFSRKNDINNICITLNWNMRLYYLTLKFMVISLIQYWKLFRFLIMTILSCLLSSG